jgi:hypothetical protein
MGNDLHRFGVPDTAQDGADSGATYLRRLKQQTQDPAAAATARPAPAAAGRESKEAASGAERRRQPRYKCEGSAEFRVENSSVRTWGTVTDLSLCGCYVEMQATSPPGTELSLTLEVNGIRAQVKGVVRVTYAFLGMGIAFTEIAESERERLHSMVRSLMEPVATVAPSGPSARPAPTPLPDMVDARSALGAIREFFEDKPQLSRSEFADLLRKSQKRV